MYGVVNHLVAIASLEAEPREPPAPRPQQDFLLPVASFWIAEGGCPEVREVAGIGARECDVPQSDSQDPSILGAGELRLLPGLCMEFITAA